MHVVPVYVLKPCSWAKLTLADQDNTSDLPNLRFGFNYLSFASDGWPILTETR